MHSLFSVDPIRVAEVASEIAQACSQLRYVDLPQEYRGSDHRVRFMELCQGQWLARVWTRCDGDLIGYAIVDAADF